MSPGGLPGDQLQGGKVPPGLLQVQDLRADAGGEGKDERRVPLDC